MTDTNDSTSPDERRFELNRATVVVAIVGFLLFFVASGALVGTRAPTTEQPFPFNHRIHVVDNEMACSECHQYYESEAFSGLPSRATCEFCHEEPIGEREAEQRFVELLQSGASLDWKPLFVQPAHVYYSHRRHVLAAKMECEQCHEDIGQSERPPTRVRQLTMDDCVHCHEEERVVAECTTCHR
jgi:hypothetical protein